MVNKHYSKEELDKIFLGVKNDYSLSKLEEILQRPASGIMQKIIRLSKEYPSKLNTRKAYSYFYEYFETKGLIERYKHEIQDYLKEHPDAIIDDIKRKKLGWQFSLAYHSNINQARKDIGRDIDSERRKRLLDYIIGNPNLSTRRFNRKMRYYVTCLYGNINQARIDAGVVTKNHVSAAEASRILNTSKSWVSELYRKNKLSGFKLGKRLFISKKSIKKLRDK